MRSKAKKVFYYNASASSLGGIIHAPVKQFIPAQASVSLPGVGGHAQQRTEAFHLDDVISCNAAYTHVSGHEASEDGPWTTLITATVDNLNILEVVTADRVVAQLSIEYRLGSQFPRVSFTGSRFENLRIGGFDPKLAYNPTLLGLRAKGSDVLPPLEWPIFLETGRTQAVKLMDGITADHGGDAYRWLAERLGWMASREIKEGDTVLCSLIDGIDAQIPGNDFGHVIDIADFGRLYLGEVTAHGHTVELTMIRAELGCSTSGSVSAGKGSGGGTHVPPP